LVTKYPEASGSKSVIGHEIYSLVGVLGAREFAKDSKILNILLEVKFFNLSLQPSNTQSQIKRYILPELSGYFEMFQATFRIDPQESSKQGALLSAATLAAGFRDTLSLLVRFRNIMDPDLIRSVIRIIHKFMIVYPRETDFHQILYEAALKACKLEHLLRLKLSSQNQTSAPELDRAVTLRKGLTYCLIRSYTLDENLSEEAVQKGRTFAFLSRVVLDLIEEESILSNDVVQPAKDEKETDLAVVLGGKSANGSIYRYSIKIVASLCSYTSSKSHHHVPLTPNKSQTRNFTFVFKLVTQKFQVAKLITAYAACDKEPLKEYYLQMLILLATCAGNSGSDELLQVFCNQCCLVLGNTSLRDRWKGLTTAVSAALERIFEISIKDSRVLSSFYKCLVTEYLRLRIDQGPFDDLWVIPTQYFMSWVAKVNRMLSMFEDNQLYVDRPPDLTMKFWLFVMIDYSEIIKNDPGSILTFASAFSTLIEPSERTYSNSFLVCDLIFQQELTPPIQNRIKKSVASLKGNYSKYFYGLKDQESLYLLAILTVIDTKIETLKNKPKSLLHDLGSQGSVLKDILCYLDNYLLLDRQFKVYREKLQSLLITLANEYINELVDTADLQIQQELAHRDFIILVQFTLSACTPFVETSRSYLIYYLKLFPPVFFKEGVLETLSFCIDKLINKLSLNYSNISEHIPFPYFNQTIMAMSSKEGLNQALNLIVSVLTNLYFSAFVMSRYLTKSIVENYLKSSKDYYADESLGKVYLSYISQLEPELKDATPNANYFLIWLKNIRGFDDQLKFEQKRFTPFMKSILKAYQKPYSQINLMEMKTLLSKAPQSEKNFLEHFVGALDLNEERLSKKLKDLNQTCMNLEVCLILKKLESKHENCLLQLVRF
jgi:hypothetical protein